MLNDKVSYFSYLDVSGNIYYISDMDSAEVIKKVLTCKRNDVLNINGLGTFKIFHIYYQAHHDEDYTYKEIGLMCNRLDV